MFVHLWGSNKFVGFQSGVVHQYGQTGLVYGTPSILCGPRSIRLCLYIGIHVKTERERTRDRERERERKIFHGG